MGNQQNSDGCNLIHGRMSSFGFTESPFNYQSEVRFFYPAHSRFSILTKILRQYEQHFVRIMVVGKKESGKTHLAQALTALLAEERRAELRYFRPLDIPGREETLRILLDALQLNYTVN